jgi:hypothetical protein
MRYYLRTYFIVLSLFVLIACYSEPHQRETESTGVLQQPVVGGQQDIRFPAIGALVIDQRTFCTGTLISSRLVITAAHCITAAKSYQSQGKLQFRIDIPKDASFEPRYHNVDQLETHPQYGSTYTGILNDLGYMVLSEDIDDVTPMPIHNKTMEQEWVGRKILFLGYGLIQTRPQQVSPDSKYGAEITMVSLSADRFETKDTSKSICSGDSGGPALYMLDNRMTLIGVNSYVTGSVLNNRSPACDGSGHSFRVDSYNAWLQPLINRYGGKCQIDDDCGFCYQCDTAQNKCVIKGTNPSAQYCKPCAAPKDCGESGSNLCIRQPAGNRCLQACEANDCCPLGTTCKVASSGIKQCVPDSGQCPTLDCKTEADCGPGEQCTKAQCEPKPVAILPSLCKKCASNTDCDANSLCVDYLDGKYCAQPCAYDNFCPTGYSCKLLSGKFYCISASGECKCQNDTNCHTGFVCTEEVCQRPGGGKYGDVCAQLRPCATDYKCIETEDGHYCFKPCLGIYPAGTPGSPCKENGSCENGANCYTIYANNTLCLRTCRSNADCVTGGICRNLGSASFCSCVNDSECKDGYTCNSDALRTFGMCAIKSNASNECDNSFVCRYSMATSYLCHPEPTQEPGEQCDDSSLCKSGMLCARTTNDQALCVRICRDDNSCQPEGGTCTRSPGFRFCSCANSTSCKYGYRCQTISGQTSICIQAPKCQNSGDCKSDELCKNGVCVSAKCARDDNCAPAESCVAGQCVAKSSPETTPQELPNTPDEITPPDAGTQPDTAVADLSTAADTNTAEQDAHTDNAKPQDLDQLDDMPPANLGGGCACHSVPASPYHPLLLWLIFLLPLGILRHTSRR